MINYIKNNSVIFLVGYNVAPPMLQSQVQESFQTIEETGTVFSLVGLPRHLVMAVIFFVGLDHLIFFRHNMN